MKTQGAAVQIALVAGALLAGMLLDRLVQTTGGHSSSRESPTATSDNNTISPALSSGHSTPPGLEPSGSESHSDVAIGLRASATKASLDTILAQPDQRQRLRDLQAFIISGVTAEDESDKRFRLRA